MACKVCSSDCNYKDMTSSFSIYVFDEFKSAAVVPCNKKGSFQRQTGDDLTFKANERTYTVKCHKGQNKSVMHGKGWRSFVADNNLGKGQMVSFYLYEPSPWAAVSYIQIRNDSEDEQPPDEKIQAYMVCKVCSSDCNYKDTTNSFSIYVFEEFKSTAAIFQRYPRPEKECQSFSLISHDRSLDIICKDKDEAEVWFAGLKTLISRSHQRKWRTDSRSDTISSAATSPRTYTRQSSPLSSPFSSNDSLHKDFNENYRLRSPYGSPPKNGLEKAFSDVVLYAAPPRGFFPSDSNAASVHSMSSGQSDNTNGNSRGIPMDAFRVSYSSAVSSSSHGSGYDDGDALGARATRAAESQPPQRPPLLRSLPCRRRWPARAKPAR